MPNGATDAVAILSAPGFDYQDNAQNTAAYQYWTEVSDSGEVEIDQVKADTYRLTVYAKGIFGDFVYENISVAAGGVMDSGTINWDAESHGEEVWRIGVPDKTAGEYKHGYATDDSHPLRPPQYRIYWGAYDFVDEFPAGVNFTVGESQEGVDFNYIHWSVFGGTLNRPGIVAAATVNNWTVNFEMNAMQLQAKQATLTVQLAGVSTDAGNTDIFSSKVPYSNLPWTPVINGHELEPFVIP